MTRKPLAAALLAALLFAGCGSPASDPAMPSPAATPKPTVDALFPDMAPVEAGSFDMGAAEGFSDQQPAHTVRLTRNFYIARYAVTFEEYDRFCADTGRTPPPDRGGRGAIPVIEVSWYDAAAYCNWLSEKAGLTPCYRGSGKTIQCDFSANGYRLPTEAEWEYAARGGQASQGYLYAGGDNPDEVAWYAANSAGVMHPVGQKKPNELGLYDMSGNLYEWCWDWYDAEYYAVSPADDPKGPASPPAVTTPRGPERVRRSGSWREEEFSVRVTFRSFDYATYVGDNGFRLVRTK